jgi:hypothetical protein
VKAIGLAPDAGQSLPHLGAPSSLSGGMLTGAAQDLATHHAVGLPRGWRRSAKLGAGAGARVCGTAVAAIVPGGIRQHHRRLDTGSHGPGLALVRGMAGQLPVPAPLVLSHSSLLHGQ